MAKGTYGSISRRAAAHAVDLLLRSAAESRVIVVIPPPDPSWSDEMKAAHIALHGGHTITFRRYPPG